jgi:flavin reductase (DIM6/NTAB) family NADH-FMN oxidoreductase RutF
MPPPDAYYYEPATGHGLPHDPFNAIIGPRPIGWISTVNEQGARNLAPYSFFNGFNYRPPIIGFSSTSWKHTVANVRATGGFVWNLATRDLAEQMNATCANVGPEVDEFELAGLAGLPSRHVQAQRVAESPVNFECKLTQFIQLQDAAGKAIEAWMVLGEVVAVHIDRSFLKEGIYRTGEAGHILRAGGPAAYAAITPDVMFEMHRPA